MIPRVNINRKRSIRRFARATTNALWKANKPVLQDLLIRSLHVHKNREILCEFQLELLGRIVGTDLVRRKCARYREFAGRALRTLATKKADIERIKRAQQLVDDMEDTEHSARFIIEKLRSIGDGIAWRVLNYDRANLRLVAEHAPISAPQIDSGLVAELGVFTQLASEETGLVLINAATNFIRVGDITVFNPETNRVELVEVKAGPSTTDRTKRQSRYRRIVQQDLDSGVHSVADEQMRKVVTEKPLQTHVRSIEHAIQAADNRLESSRRFGDYLGVAVLAVSKIIDTVPEKDWAPIWNRALDRMYSIGERNSDILMPYMTSWFHAVNFSPNMAPYAVFPIEPELRFSLMTGETMVFSIINISGLARWLNKRGWEAEVIPIPEDVDDIDLENPMALPVLRVSDGRRSVEINMTYFLIATVEFHMPEAVETCVQALMSMMPKDKPRDVEREMLSTITYPNTGKYAWD